jgi:hypothetical protein
VRASSRRSFTEENWLIPDEEQLHYSRQRAVARPRELRLSSSYPVTLGGLGKAAATHPWQVGKTIDIRQIESAAAGPNLRRRSDATTTEPDIEFRNVADGRRS